MTASMTTRATLLGAAGAALATWWLHGAGYALAASAPPNAEYFTKCLSLALQTKAISRDGSVLRLACYGETAEWFFNALGRRDPDVSTEKTYGDDIYRYVDHADKPASNVNYCRRAAKSAADQQYACVLFFPAGSFLDR
jgi:hypothetical protein